MGPATQSPGAPSIAPRWVGRIPSTPPTLHPPQRSAAPSKLRSGGNGNPPPRHSLHPPQRSGAHPSSAWVGTYTLHTAHSSPSPALGCPIQAPLGWECIPSTPPTLHPLQRSGAPSKLRLGGNVYPSLDRPCPASEIAPGFSPDIPLTLDPEVLPPPKNYSSRKHSAKSHVKPHRSTQSSYSAQTKCVTHK